MSNEDSQEMTIDQSLLFEHKTQVQRMLQQYNKLTNNYRLDQWHKYCQTGGCHIQSSRCDCIFHHISLSDDVPANFRVDGSILKHWLRCLSVHLLMYMWLLEGDCNGLGLGRCRVAMGNEVVKCSSREGNAVWWQFPVSRVSCRDGRYPVQVLNRKSRYH